LNIATRKEIILGTNQYPNTGESIKEEIAETILKNSNYKEKDIEVEVLKPYRGSQTVEILRYQTDQYAKKNKRPKVFLITIGNMAMRRARAQFSGNFFGCAGYEIIDNIGFKTVDEAAKACIKSGAEIAVICSSDDEYAELVPSLFDRLSSKTIVVIAGYPKTIIDDLQQKGIKHFIHVKSNVLETLTEFQNLITQ